MIGRKALARLLFRRTPARGERNVPEAAAGAGPSEDEATSAGSDTYRLRWGIAYSVDGRNAEGEVVKARLEGISVYAEPIEHTEEID